METSQTMTELNRVRRNTPPEILRRIDEQTERNIRFYSSQPWEEISRRIAELQEEWSVERFLELQVSAVGLTTAVLALFGSKKWALVTCTVLGMFLLHGVRGGYPPLAMIRRLGVRTRGEIDQEMYALKAMRGDFEGVPTDFNGSEVRKAAKQVAGAVAQN